MTLPYRHSTTSVPSTPDAQRRQDRVWLLIVVVLGVWVATRLGAFHLWADVATNNGRAVRLPDGFASIDHPFHAARAETLRRSLMDGSLLRWIAQHQGGYPVEFYPLGMPWLEVGVWSLLLGSLPIVVIHKLVVIAIFLLPGLGYLLLSLRDGWPLDTAVVAFVAHLMVPGIWWQGGYTELVEWGMVTNVAGSYIMLFVLLLLSRYLVTGRNVFVVAMAFLAAFAVTTNPRTLVALAIVGVSAGLAAMTYFGGPQMRMPRLAIRLILGAVLTASLAAPVLQGLVRFSDLYYFAQYAWYEAPVDYFRASIQALSWPVFLFAIGGMVAGLVLPNRPLTRTVAIALVLYSAMSMVLSFTVDASGLLSNLETPRLMPFQRLLAIYLAGVAFHLFALWVAGVVRVRAMPIINLAVVGAITAMVVLPMGSLAPASPPGEIPAAARSLYPIPTTASPEQLAFADAMQAADRTSTPGTAILILGSSLSWHQQLWAPFWTDRMLFYDDWLWNWHTRHVAPGYDYRTGNAYAPAMLASTLTRAYLDRHGIGAVVVASSDRAAGVKLQAAQSPLLVPIRSGNYDVYAVREPKTIVTFGTANVITTTLSNERVVATGTSTGGEALIRRNWFPRWQATVNNRPVSLTQTPDGYIRVALPPGEVRLELIYGVDVIDWLARLSSVLGGIAALALLSRPAWTKFQQRSS